ncbi:MAG TPA: SIMPL domain-containing protein [Candidatus Absconditabacterales bacterium]|nr:SIMPL domain-containing protein [Candidatus Absconditabacterales bacterium]
MENKGIIKTVIISGAIIISAFLISQTGVYIKDTSNNQLPKNLISNTISVNGEGKIFAKPDMVILTIAASEQGKTTQEAQKKTNDKLAQIQQILAKKGISKDDIQTSNISMYPEYNYENNSSKMVGYRSNHTLTIKIKKITDEKNGSDIIDEVSKIGDIQLQNIQYDIEDKAKLFTEARKLAYQKAFTKAQEIAAISQVKLSKPLSIAEQQTNIFSPQPMYRNIMSAKAEMATDAVAPTADISVGQLEFSINLDIVYTIE